METQNKVLSLAELTTITERLAETLRGNAQGVADVEALVAHILAVGQYPLR